MNPRKRATEERDSKRASARNHQEKGVPYLEFGVDSRAPLQQGSYRFLMSVLGGSEKRSGPVLFHRRSGASQKFINFFVKI
jgi:hypothetical protein